MEESEQDGRLYADPDGGWYYVVDVQSNGDEKRVVSSNRLSHVQGSAERFSCEVPPQFRGDVKLIDGKTHRAIALYEKDKGLKAGWEETDDRKAVVRKEAYLRGQSLIHFNLSKY